MSKTPCLLVMAGGTGGHIFPALAVAQHLKELGWEVQWLGTKDRMEATLVPQYGIKINFIEVQGLKGKGLTRLLSAPLMLLKAIFQAKKVINTVKPDVVLGMGGYVSGPGGVAAYLSKTPLLIHEQNGVAGVTNKWLSYIATEVMQAFGSAFLESKAKTVGNPVRKELFSLPSIEERYLPRKDKLLILVIGGSQGAKILNDTIPFVAKALEESTIFYHQVGKNNFDKVKEKYDELGVKQYEIHEFINDMEKAYLNADLVICRSGALTVSELAVVGLPAIFVPFMHKDNQQLHNAKWLANNGAAIIVEQNVLTTDKLIQIIHELDREKLIEMAHKSKAQVQKNATELVANKLIEIKK
ncbi:undecaprenyldiphospho-muramoylpentapeptide beta-N-acetylglucosaminyltransferase [Thorsellia kenyensis]|uniref:UDP-N-acetylglucosamine--N-acetylmuramyl-(pentapeptide) pyrophosphoryl-undecaprenol N-acetylglucosamine transferase n=1 Tax=Thorsellia kenyensis TaxID=1549888 RepID=A0ABV6CBN4_9GAMM